MKSTGLKKLALVLAMLIAMTVGMTTIVLASDTSEKQMEETEIRTVEADSTAVAENSETTAASSAHVTSSKAIAVAIAIGLAAAGGAIAMGMAASKSVEGISRQPEAEGSIRTTFMLGLVFIETAIIYALLAVILIIFVL